MTFFLQNYSFLIFINDFFKIYKNRNDDCNLVAVVVVVTAIVFVIVGTHQHSQYHTYHTGTYFSEFHSFIDHDLSIPTLVLCLNRFFCAQKLHNWAIQNIKNRSVIIELGRNDTVYLSTVMQQCAFG